MNYFMGMIIEGGISLMTKYEAKFPYTTLDCFFGMENMFQFCNKKILTPTHVKLKVLSVISRYATYQSPNDLRDR